MISVISMISMVISVLMWLVLLVARCEESHWVATGVLLQAGVWVIT